MLKCNNSPAIPEFNKLVDRLNRFSVGKCLYSRDAQTNLFTMSYFIRNEKTQITCKLVLRDAWAQTPFLKEGTIINISGTNPDENGVFNIERDHGFLIVEPDRLVSVTSVVSMCWCARKVAFSERFRFPFESVDALRGIIAHELISKAMLKKITHLEGVQEELNIILSQPDIMDKAYGSGLSQKQLEQLGSELTLWCLSFTAQRMMSRQSNQKWNIEKVIEIEDCYWNPEFGIKGKIDCTVEVKNEHGKLKNIPLEFKTGNPIFSGKTKVQAEHLGQVYLYTLLMRSATEPENKNNDGILHYIREEFFKECSATMRDLQGLIIARNQIIFNTPMNGMNAFAALPSPSNVDFNFHCQRCEYKDICAVVLKTNPSNEDHEPSIAEKKLKSSVDHLSDEELIFFNKWLQVINLEADEDEISYNSKNLWLQTVAQREKDGNCLGGLKLKHQSQDSSTSSVYVGLSIPESKRIHIANIFERDFIILGTDTNPCISFGSVEAINQRSITVCIERFVSERYLGSGIHFSVDKIKSNSAGMMQFVYLTKLMEDSPDALRIRKYLVQKTPPVFRTLAAKELTGDVQKVLLHYNRLQRTTILKCITTDNFLLVKGSPGCGKTTTIVGLIRLLVLQKKSVLISTYTSNALDNILLSYKRYSTDFIRIGSGGKLKQDELGDYTSNTIRKTAVTVDNLSELYNKPLVVATTLLSLKHAIFNVRKFDYCIIDEGSQALPPAVFGVMMYAKKCIVFGDPNQLPATIKSKQIKSLKIEDNIFTMFPHPKYSCSLSVQYRMNQHIMKLANELVYDNSMQCATEEQAQAGLKILTNQSRNYLLEKIPLAETRAWLCLAISRKSERSVMFFDTENIEAYDQVVTATLQNKKESDIALAIVQLLTESGISTDAIGLIAPYRGQVHLLRERLQDHGLDIEVNTIDQYQGREKNVIIVSFTKSQSGVGNGAEIQESILNDIRRLNVAITRAKAKVILIGNSKTLLKFPACGRLLSLIGVHQQYKFSPADFFNNFFKD